MVSKEERRRTQSKILFQKNNSFKLFISSKKDVKNFQFVAVTKLPLVATALHIPPECSPISSMLSLVAQQKSKKVRGSESISKKGQLTFSRVNRIVGSSENDVVFKVTIDGISWKGVKFVSVSAESNSSLKSFPIMYFGK